ncbi:MAG: NAD(P)H-dependent oxidoreductase [Psychroserpens sp.]|uniref:FMN-dependent NADH-azoreductase n=1 Tax=Psychroserpens sp. TaxID=2020870 RepID=UPI0030034FE0
MNILKINSSSNRKTSTSRKYVDEIIAKIQSQGSDLEVTERDVAYSELPFIDESFLNALFVKGERTPEQQDALCLSDTLVDELVKADYIVIGSPIYNFSIPASLKAYFDLVARAGRTFQYTENGPVGLLKDKKVFVVISSGGTAIGSAIDFSSKYIIHFLSFLGITDVEIISLDQLMIKQEETIKQVEHKIEQIEI